jgi:N-acetylglucosamine kinase-like BadF-type ATPase
VGAAEGRAKFVRVIGECLEAARKSAGLDETVRFAAACLGFSGGPDDKRAILAELIASDRMFVTDDAAIALAGATAGEPGIIVIAGTGSIAFGRNAEGRTARAGGWGYLFGDEGGAFDIVRQALRASLRFEEGWGPPTSLRQALLDASGARDANELMHRFYTAEYPRSSVAGFAKLVDAAAEDGDSRAQEILRQASERLAEINAAVRSQLFKPGERVKTSYLGGVFRSARVLGRFRELVPEVSPPIHGPAAGALLEAYRAVGIRCPLTDIPREKD